MTIIEDGIPDFAVDALMMLAVVLIEMQKCLCISSIAHRLSQHAPLTDDGVVLRRNEFHQRHRLLRFQRVIPMQRISVLIRNDGINEQDIYTAAAHLIHCKELMQGVQII